MLATQTKKKSGKKPRKIRQHDRKTSIFSDLFLSFYFFLCCQHKFKIIMYLVSKFKFPNISLKNIQRKSHNTLKIIIESEKKNTQIWKRAYYISPHHSPPLENTTFSPFRFVAAPQKFKKI